MGEGYGSVTQIPPHTIGMKESGMPSRECPEATLDVSAMAKGHVNFIPPPECVRGFPSSDG